MPSDAHDLLFLKTKVCVLCAKGFEIMDLEEYVSLQRRRPCPNSAYISFSSATIPLDEDLRGLGKRPGTCKPVAMFRIRNDEFLLCYEGKASVPAFIQAN